MNAPPAGEPPPAQPRPTETIEDGGAPRLLSGPAGRALAVLAALNLVGYLDRYVVAALFESLRADLWVTDARLGFLGSGFVLVHVVAAPLLGPLGDRRRRPRLLALGAALAGVATVLCGLARGYWTLLAARLAVAIGQAAHGAIAPGLLADHLGPARRGRARALVLAAIPLGAALGYAAGGLLDRTLGWRAAFFGAGAPAVLLALAALRLRDPPRGPAGRAGAPPGRAELSAWWRELRADRRRALAVLGFAAYAFAVGALSWWTPAFLERARGVPRAAASLQLAAIVVLAGFLGTFAGGHVAEALRRRRREADLWVCGISALAAAPLALAAFTAWRSGIYLVALVLAQTLLFASTGPVTAALGAGVRPAGRAGAAATTILAVHLLGDVPAPWLVGLVSDRSSLGRAVLLVPAALLVAGAAWTYAAWRGGRGAAPPSR